MRLPILDRIVSCPFFIVMKKFLLIVAVIGCAISFLKMTSSSSPFSFNIKQNDSLLETSIDIKTLREIGEWEFLSVRVEELVDTTISNVFFDDQLSCIYRGDVRLGFDMRDFDLKNIDVRGDTAFVKLPHCKILDTDFIDESQTSVFFQKGNVEPSIYVDLKKRAKNKMIDRALASENLALADKTAENSISSLLKDMGMSDVYFVK